MKIVILGITVKPRFNALVGRGAKSNWGGRRDFFQVKKTIVNIIIKNKSEPFQFIFYYNVYN